MKCNFRGVWRKTTRIVTASLHCAHIQVLFAVLLTFCIRTHWIYWQHEHALRFKLNTRCYCLHCLLFTKLELLVNIPWILCCVCWWRWIVCVARGHSCRKSFTSTKAHWILILYCFSGCVLSRLCWEYENWIDYVWRRHKPTVFHGNP